MNRSDALCEFAPLPPCVHAELVGRWPHLATREDLSTDAWWALWSSKPDVDTATLLVERDLDDDQLDAVVAREKRQSVLVRLTTLHRDRLSGARLEAVARHARGALAADIATLFGAAAPAALVARMDPADRMGWIAACDPATLDDDAVRALVADPASWIPDRRSGSRQRAAALAVLVHRREAARDVFTDELPEHAYAPLAGALSIWPDEVQDRVSGRIVAGDMRWAAMALAGNPVCSTANRERLAAYARDTEHWKLAELLGRDLGRTDGDPRTCTDATQVRHVVRRACCSDWRPQGRPGHLVYLSSAIDTLDEEVLEPLAAGLSVIDEPGAHDALVALAARVGDDGHDVFGHHLWHLVQTALAVGTTTVHPPDPAGAAATAPRAADEQDPDRWRQLPVRTLETWRSQRGWPDIAQHHRGTLAGMAGDMGDSPAAWETLLTMAGSFPGTLGELAAVARATVQ